MSNSPTDATRPQEAAGATTPCPVPWCEQDHTPRHLDDGHHRGPITVATITNRTHDKVRPGALLLTMGQDITDCCPHITLVVDDEPTSHELTLDRAEGIAREMLRLVAAGRAGQSAGRAGEGHPAWCSRREDDDDTSHASDDREAGPFLARLWQNGDEPPTVNVIRDELRDDYERDLTAAEAEELGMVLLGLGATARQAVPAGSRLRSAEPRTGEHLAARVAELEARVDDLDRDHDRQVVILGDVLEAMLDARVPMVQTLDGSPDTDTDTDE